MIKTWTIVALAAFALAAPAFALRRGVDVFARYDKNSNGVLEADEKEAIKKAFATDPDLKKYDTNGDGKLDDKEIAAIKPEAPKKKKDK